MFFISDCNFEKREVESFITDLAENILHSGGIPETLSKNGKHHHSVVGNILVQPSDMGHVCPPVLHITLGLVLKFLGILTKWVRSVDNSNIGEELQQALDTAMVLLYESQHELNDLKEQLQDVGSLLQKLLGKESKLKESDECEAIHCIASKSDRDMVCCDICDKWYHNRCINVTSEQLENINSTDGNFTCIFCVQDIGSKQNLEEYFLKLRLELSQMVSDKKNEVQLNAKKHAEIQDKIESMKGPIEKELDSILEHLGIERQAYHSQSLVGNHCHKILHNIDKLCVIFDSHELLAPNKDKFVLLLKKYKDIYDLMTASRFLSTDEGQTLVSNCINFGQFFPLNFPTESLPIKFHLLTVEVPRFVKRWHTIGLMSEQGLESIHNVCNNVHRRFCCVRDKAKQLGLVYTHLACNRTKVSYKKKRPSKE